MHTIIRSRNRACLTNIMRNCIVSVSQKSYYQILGVSKTAKTKQIRSQFLKKARQLHPDHNPSPEAQENFKLLKQAYETLKDPQRRYIYDSGISTDGVNQSVYSGATDWKETGKKYYQNKWYDYRKSNYQDQRDQYYQDKFAVDQQAYQRKLWYRAIGLSIVVIGYFGYDYLFNKKSARYAQKQHIKNLIQGQQQDKKTRKMRRYIQQRAKLNQVE